VCLGTNQFGTAQSEELSGTILKTFFEAGGNFIDTAHSYGDWVPHVPRAASERTLGVLLKDKARGEYVLATKGCEFDHRLGQGPRVTAEFLHRDIEDSLEALRMEFIDLFWLHRDDRSRSVKELLDALIVHQVAGRIRYFGCSNWSVERIGDAQAYAKSLGHDGFIACQPMGGLAIPDTGALRQYSQGVHYASGFRALHEAGLTMIPYSSQSMGFFTKLEKGGIESLSDLLRGLYVTPQNLRRAAVVFRIAKSRGRCANDVVLAYLISQPLLTIPIIGVNGPQQLQQSLKAVSFRLTSDEIQMLEVA
jgi:aryl-alcohol dehydrogenase-like predicted oxidoreductase